MKTRHIVMLIILVLAVLIMVSIKESKTTKTLTCSVKGTMYEMESTTTLKVQVKDNEVKNMNVAIDVTIPEEYASQKQNLIESIRSEGKMQVTSTDKGFKLSTGLYSEYFDTFGLNRHSSYQELRKTLELQGYTCK